MASNNSNGYCHLCLIVLRDSSEDNPRHKHLYSRMKTSNSSPLCPYRKIHISYGTSYGNDQQHLHGFAIGGAPIPVFIKFWTDFLYYLLPASDIFKRVPPCACITVYTSSFYFWLSWKKDYINLSFPWKSNKLIYIFLCGRATLLWSAYYLISKHNLKEVKRLYVVKRSLRHCNAVQL